MRLQIGFLEIAADLALRNRGNDSSPNDFPVNSRCVQRLMGRPDFSGGSQATANTCVTCSAVKVPGCHRGASLSTC